MPETTPDLTRCAVLTIDVQNDFTLPDAPHAVPDTDRLVPAMAKVVAAFRAARLPVVHVVRLYLADGSNAEPCRRDLLASGQSLVRPGTGGSQIRAELHPGGDPVTLDHEALLAGKIQQVGPAEWAVFKPRWGAFFGTDLHPHLRSCGVDTLAVVGANFPNCPRTTIYEASERDYHVVVVSDAISRTYPRGLEECAGIGAHVLTADRLTELLGSQDPVGRNT